MFGAIQKALNPRKAQKCGDCAASQARREKYTLLNAAVDTLKGDFATEEVRAERLKVCHSCAYLSKKPDRCQLCGCFVYLKAGLASASCDINRW